MSLAPDPKPRRRPIVLASGVLALLVAAGVGWSMLGQGGGRKPQERVVPVMAAAASTKAVPVQISTYGRVQTMASVALRARIDGVIAAVKVQEGQDVKAGDVLFLLDDREAKAKLKQAEGAVQRDRAQLDNARRDLDRYLPLEQKSFVSKQQIDLARSNVAALDGTLAADVANAENARVQLSYTVITAPIAGRVGSISQKVGNNVHANDAVPLLTINQLKPIYVAISVPQDSFPALQEAMSAGPVPVQVSIEGDAKPIESGTISFTENAIDNMTNTVGLRATFANDALRLWPGQFVNALITLKVEQNATVVPSEAVQTGPNGTFVFTISPDNTVAMRPVDVNRTIGTEAVIAKGLKPGERIVTSGQLALEPGAKVRVKGADAAPDGEHAGDRS